MFIRLSTKLRRSQVCRYTARLPRLLAYPPQDGLAHRLMTAAASLVGFTARTFHAPKARDGTQILSKKRTPPFDGRVKGGQPSSYFSVRDFQHGRRFHSFVRVSPALFSILLSLNNKQGCPQYSVLVFDRKKQMNDGAFICFLFLQFYKMRFTHLFLHALLRQRAKD